MTEISRRHVLGKRRRRHAGLARCRRRGRPGAAAVRSGAQGARRQGTAVIPVSARRTSGQDLGRRLGEGSDGRRIPGFGEDRGRPDAARARRASRVALAHQRGGVGLCDHGTCRVTTIDPQGKSEIADFGAGDVWYFPRGYGHSIQAIGRENCQFVLVFDNGYFSEFGTFSISDWIGHTPPDVLQKNFGVPARDFRELSRRSEVYIAKGAVPPPLPADPRLDRSTAARSRTVIACWRRSRGSIAAAPTAWCRSGSFRSRRR